MPNSTQMGWTKSMYVLYMGSETARDTSNFFVNKIFTATSTPELHITIKTRMFQNASTKVSTSKEKLLNLR